MKCHGSNCARTKGSKLLSTEQYLFGSAVRILKVISGELLNTHGLLSL